MSRYGGGADAERELKAAFELACPGCLAVRSAGSHTAADLVVMNPEDGTDYVVQVKKVTAPCRFNPALADAVKELRTIRLHEDTHCRIAALRCRGVWTIFYLSGEGMKPYISSEWTREIQEAVKTLRSKKMGKVTSKQ